MFKEDKNSRFNRINYNILQGNSINYLFVPLDTLSFHYALKGKFKFRDDFLGKSYSLSPGEFLIAKTDKEYLLQNQTDSTSLLFSIIIPKELFKASFANLLTQDCALNDFLKQNEIAFAIPEMQDGSALQQKLVKEIITSFITTSYSEGSVSQQDLVMVTKQILIFLEYIFANNKLAPSPIVKEIVAYIQENMAEANLKAASKRYNYSTSYLSELIRKETGYTFSQLLSSARMDRSKELLKGTDASLQSISQEIGYLNTSSFVTAFHDMYKITPTEFRKSNMDLS